MIDNYKTFHGLTDQIVISIDDLILSESEKVKSLPDPDGSHIIIARASLLSDTDNLAAEVGKPSFTTSQAPIAAPAREPPKESAAHNEPGVLKPIDGNTRLSTAPLFNTPAKTAPSNTGLYDRNLSIRSQPRCKLLQVTTPQHTPPTKLRDVRQAFQVSVPESHHLAHILNHLSLTTVCYGKVVLQLSACLYLNINQATNQVHTHFLDHNRIRFKVQAQSQSTRYRRKSYRIQHNRPTLARSTRTPPGHGPHTLAHNPLTHSIEYLQAKAR